MKEILFLEKEYNPKDKSLAIYRILFASYFLIFGCPSFTWIKGNPDIFFSPQIFNIAVFFDHFPSILFFQVLDYLVVFLFICLFFGYKTKQVCIVLAITMVLGNSFKHALGKIDNKTLFEVTILLMAFSSWGKCYSLDAYKNKDSATSQTPKFNSIAFIALCIGVGFCTAGIPKLLGWIDGDLSRQGIRMWLNKNYFIDHRDKYLLEYFVFNSSPIFLELMDYIVVIFEISFFCACFRKRFFSIFLCLAVAFHMATYLVLNIGFVIHLPIYAAFVDWEKIIKLPKLEMEFKNLFLIFIVFLIIYSITFIFLFPFNGIIPFIEMFFTIPIDLTLFQLLAANVFVMYLICYRYFKRNTIVRDTNGLA